MPSSQSSGVLSLSRGDRWRSKRDGRIFEVEYVAQGRGGESPRVQLKPANAKNLKSTRWLDLWNLPLRYDRLIEVDEPVSMTDLDPGDVWDLPGGKRVEVLDRAFLWGGIRWVAVNDHDFDGIDPSVFKVARFNGGRRVS